MKQAEEFLNGEGDNWYERNKHAELNYTVINSILDLGAKPDRILEVGCGNARYLGELHRYYGCEALGFDASEKAISEGRKNYPKLILEEDTAVGALEELVLYKDQLGCKYDIVIFGFCLYIMDREDIFSIVYLTDQILMDGGYIVIHDFDPVTPTKVPYKHKEGLFTYKMNYAGLWLANPEYKMISKTVTAPGETITIIKKVGW